MPTLLIVSADDFGASLAINAAVARAFDAGVLTSASLMATGPAAQDAVAIAGERPRLAVGLHLVLNDMPNPIPAALGYQFRASMRRKAAREIAAQFEAFAATGLPLSHVDGHQHLHAHPAVIAAVIEQALKHGAHGIRIPRDPFWPNLRADRTRMLYKITVALGHAYLARMCREALRGVGLSSCDACIGSLMSGNMSAAYVIAMLESVSCRSVEVYLHPSEDPNDHCPYGPNCGDLEALLSPAFKRFIRERDIGLATYADLKDEPVEASHERA